MAKIFANMIVGDKLEPYLYFCLKSIVEVIDEIIIVANPNNENSSLLQGFPKTKIIYSEFIDFATARNTCLEYSKRADYILWVDADEVHFTKNLQAVIDGVIEKKTSGAMCAFFHFVKDFYHYQSLDPRVILFKNLPGLKWVGKVDERIEGLPNNISRTNYKYHHYGYTKPQRNIWKEWIRREKILGTTEWFHDKDPDTILNDRETKKYIGPYPDDIKAYIGGGK